MNEVQIFEQLINFNGRNIGKIAILIGGLNHPNPKEYMDGIVFQYVGSLGHNQFVEIHLDNPWTRVVTIGINNLPLRQMLPTDTLRFEP